MLTFSTPTGRPACWRVGNRRWQAVHGSRTRSQQPLAGLRSGSACVCCAGRGARQVPLQHCHVAADRGRGYSESPCRRGEAGRSSALRMKDSRLARVSHAPILNEQLNLIRVITGLSGHQSVPPSWRASDESHRSFQSPKTPKTGLDALLRPEDSVVVLIDHQPLPVRQPAQPRTDHDRQQRRRPGQGREGVRRPDHPDHGDRRSRRQSDQGAAGRVPGPEADRPHLHQHLARPAMSPTS